MHLIKWSKIYCLVFGISKKHTLLLAKKKINFKLSKRPENFWILIYLIFFLSSQVNFLFPTFVAVAAVFPEIRYRYSMKFRLKKKEYNRYETRGLRMESRDNPHIRVKYFWQEYYKDWLYENRYSGHGSHHF